MIDDPMPEIKSKKAPKAEMPKVAILTTTNVASGDGFKSVQLLTEYGKAIHLAKKVEDLIKRLQPQVREACVREWARVNLDNVPGEPISSIKVVDANGTTFRVTGQDRYAACDEGKSAMLCEELKVPEESIIQFKLKAKFNDDVFLDQDGEFDREAYDAFNAAIRAVAKKLGKPSPLQVEKVIQVKPDFHKIRWHIAPTVAKQLAIYEAVPNTVTLTPLEVVDAKPTPPA